MGIAWKEQHSEQENKAYMTAQALFQGYQIVKILFLDDHMIYPVDQTKYRNLMMTLDLKQYT